MAPLKGYIGKSSLQNMGIHHDEDGEAAKLKLTQHPHATPTEANHSHEQSDYHGTIGTPKL